MVNSKELMIGAWVKSKKDLAKVTALYKENWQKLQPCIKKMMVFM